MEIKIILIYCFCHDLLKSIGHKDDPQSKMNTAEVLTIGICAALFFGGNIANCRQLFLWNRYITNILSESRLNRKFHEIDRSLWQFIFHSLQALFQSTNTSLEYVVDSFPVEVCANVRSYRCKLMNGKKFIGYCAAKKKFFYGFKVHVLATIDGFPIEFLILPASTADISALKIMDLEGTRIYADRAYNDFKFEDWLMETTGIQIVAQRKENSKRKHSGPLGYIQSIMRKRIETMFSCITRLFPKKIHAVTMDGFILKIILFMISYSLNKIIQVAPAKCRLQLGSVMINS